MIRCFLAMLLCCISVAAQAGDMRAIFFQPLRSDLTVPAKNWPVIFSEAKRKGFNTLVIQWTSYGDLFASKENQQWLQDRLIQALQADLKLVIGLGGDPAIFERLKQSPPAVGSYLRKTNQINNALASQWVKALPSDAIIGWYLPLEIDDRQWRTKPARAELIKYLSRQVDELTNIRFVPVYVSSFFAGNMTPERYAVMLENIELQSKVHLWVQDGGGTNKLTTAERELYLNAVSHCSSFAVSGFIFEIFNQTQADQQFAAIPLDRSRMSKALEQKNPCGGDNVFFALNYLIDFENPN